MVSSDRLYLQFICQRLDYCPTANVQCIVDVDNKTGMPIAGVIYDAYNGATIMAHIWVCEGKRPSRDWFGAIFDYPFNRLGVYKIIGQVSSANLDARKLDEHFGFRLECEIEGFYKGGHNLMVYTMTRGQCRVLTSHTWAKVTDRVSRC